MKERYDSYRRLVRILKKRCPLAFPVSIRRVKMTQKLDGDCAKYKNKFVIRINIALSENEAMDTLLHEIAHALSWNHLLDSLDQEEFVLRQHDAFWGVAYSEVYQVYEKHFLPTVEMHMSHYNKT